jgi:hypothetical protein
VIEHTNGSGVYTFPEGALTAIILGSQISAKDEEKVVEWSDRMTHPIRLYRSSPCDKSFTLKIQEVFF